ncbi:MAG: hypothetical protein QOH62_3729 [Solirubrobacteraceae bacterium]|jgi:hypothetical protein|nr:hypothetical protein [Solirubrobacteraceae bacterium]
MAGPDPAVFRRRRLTALGGAAGVLLLAVLAIDSCGSENKRAVADKPARPLVLQLPRGGRVIFPHYRVIAFYGAPQDKQLGELGIGTPARAGRKLLRQAAPYARRTRPVLPAMELIATVAANAPGADGLYRTQQTAQVINRYLHAARRLKALLVLDIQPGHADFLSEAQRLAPWLGQPDVGIALDPEWHTPGVVPGTQIGSVTAEEVNQVSDYVAGIVRAGHLPEKLFLVHQFTDGMIQGKERVLARPGLAMTFNVDGFGDRPNKLSKYAAFTAQTRGRPFADGYKLFYHEDTNLMKPADVMRMQPRPDLVVYE